MKEIQIPRKNFARSSDPGTKRIKDSELKNRKFAEKRQSATFCELSVESMKHPIDITPISQISGTLSDSEAESSVQGSSLDLLSTSEIYLPTDDSLVSTITNKDFHIGASTTDRIQSTADLPASVQSLRADINDLKKLIYSVENFEESNWIDGVFTWKFRIVLLAFILWAILAVIVVSVNSGKEVASYGPLPT